MPPRGGWELPPEGGVGLAATVPSPFKGENGQGDATFVLVRVDEKKYCLASQFCYVEPMEDKPSEIGDPDEYGVSSGDGQPRTFKVPKDDFRMETDLASVPPFLTWLVPKDGRHTPAALLHDALMPHDELWYLGPDLDRVEADRIFRNAMQHLGVAFLRRWAMWGAVSLATFMTRRPGTSGVARPAGMLFRGFVVGVVALGALAFGLAAWADLFGGRLTVPCHSPHLGSWTFDLPCMPDPPGIPGMGDQPAWREGVALLLWTAAASVAAGLSFGFVRAVRGLFAGRRSWLRALSFSVLVATLMLFAVPVLAAGAGWVGYLIIETVTMLVLLPLTGVAKLLSAAGGFPASMFGRFTGPVNPPSIRGMRP